MFIDDHGNEFETVKEIEDFARKDFYNQKECEIIDIIEDYFFISELLKWIFKNDKEKFMKDFRHIFETVEDNYVEDYFFEHDIEEI